MIKHVTAEPGRAAASRSELAQKKLQVRKKDTKKKRRCLLFVSLAMHVICIIYMCFISWWTLGPLLEQILSLGITLPGGFGVEFLQRSWWAKDSKTLTEKLLQLTIRLLKLKGVWNGF